MARVLIDGRSEVTLECEGIGFICHDFMLNRCLFHSLFGTGWVPVGNFEAHRRTKPTTVQKIAFVTTTHRL